MPTKFNNNMTSSKIAMAKVCIFLLALVDILFCMLFFSFDSMHLLFCCALEGIQKILSGRLTLQLFVIFSLYHTSILSDIM